jgi:hypothetical protein
MDKDEDLIMWKQQRKAGEEWIEKNLIELEVVLCNELEDGKLPKDPSKRIEICTKVLKAICPSIYHLGIETND